MNRITRLALPVALVIATSLLVACTQKEEVSKEETATLIAPVAKVELSGAAPAAAGKADPKHVFETVCAACHTTGAAGAPKMGDKAAWAPRIATGKDTLYKVALTGRNAMPPKGGNPSLSDDDVKAVVDYIVSQSK
ncbi:c-type cytochrome [Uliginosibacterium sp. H3]|uniref:C-type cytochrome n=1 Tax=Uliginosibacterium silvisoli TaxID=3114758 RepID=A0ABU6K0J2_9RHOO|nr:c-type cytochrome [Uliginosibacterium sp. H3]